MSMNKRKAYAIVNPVKPGDKLREGHKKRVEHRFATALWCDGELWRARVEYIGWDQQPIRLRSLNSGVINRINFIAQELIVSSECGEGVLTLIVGSPTCVEAQRPMSPGEQAALRAPQNLEG